MMEQQGVFENPVSHNQTEINVGEFIKLSTLVGGSRSSDKWNKRCK